MNISGKTVCFNCKSQRLNENKQPYTLKKLETWKKGHNPKKKGKLINYAYVCMLCYSEGHQLPPIEPGAFRGEVRLAPLPPEMMNFLRKQKEQAEQKKAEFEKIEPKYPTKKD